MIKFSTFLIEKTDAKSVLHAFDMDEVLVHHDHNKLRIHVVDPYGNRVRTLTNQEFNTHKLPQGHKYDFSEFRSSDVFSKSSAPIRKMIAKLKAIHQNGGKTAIITARGDLDSQPHFAQQMKKYGIDIGQTHVYRAGNLKGRTSDNKAIIVDGLIKKYGVKKVHLYDDSEENLNTFLKLKSKHPEVEFNAHHVEHNPKTEKVSINTRKI